MKKQKKKRLSREKQAQIKKRRKTVLTVILCVVFVCIGYIGADAYMIRHAEPVDMTESSTKSNKKSSSVSSIDDTALEVPSVSLDNSVMLESVIDRAQKGSFTALAFELKRDDGTIGYESSLTTVNSYGAVSMPARELHESIKTIKSKNIKPFAIIYCLKDNIAPQKLSNTAVMNGNEVYRDKDGNSYLNPNSEEAMRYLKEIVSESYNLGVRNFVLCSTSLPDDIKSSYNADFASLSAKLKDSAGSDAVFIQGVEENLSSGKNLEKQINNFKELKSDSVYVIKTSSDVQTVEEELKKNNKKGCIIAEEE